MDWKEERDIKIFRGQCLNLAAQTLEKENKSVMDNLDELFKRAETIYEKGKALRFLSKT